MGKWLLIVESNCADETRESEFNTWYDTIHIPDILNDSPGFKSATRYVLKNPDQPRAKHLAIYEIETEDIQKTREAHLKNVERKKAAGRWSDLLEVTERRVCKVQEW